MTGTHKNHVGLLTTLNKALTRLRQSDSHESKANLSDGVKTLTTRQGEKPHFLKKQRFPVRDGAPALLPNHKDTEEHTANASGVLGRNSYASVSLSVLVLK